MFDSVQYIIASTTHARAGVSRAQTRPPAAYQHVCRVRISSQSPAETATPEFDSVSRVDFPSPLPVDAIPGFRAAAVAIPT